MPEEFADKMLEAMNRILDGDSFKKAIETKFGKNPITKKLMGRAVLDIKDQVYQFCQSNPDQAKRMLIAMRTRINELLGET